MCIVNMARHVGFMYGSRMDTDPVACYYVLFFYLSSFLLSLPILPLLCVMYGIMWGWGFLCVYC